MKKRILAMFLSMALVLSFTTSAWAENNEEITEETEEVVEEAEEKVPEEETVQEEEKKTEGEKAPEKEKIPEEEKAPEEEKEVSEKERQEVEELPEQNEEPAEASLSDTILQEFDALERELSELSEDECGEFYQKMMETYRKAFEDDQCIVSANVLAQIDRKFCALYQWLSEQYGFSDVEGAVMSVSTFQAKEQTAEKPDSEELIHTQKKVTVGETGVSDFLLTLESYVNGNVDYVQPVDLILSLDQSASMYTPMGTTMKTHKELFVESSSNLQRYALDNSEGCIDLESAFLSTDIDKTGLTFREKLSQLGYLVAQSRVGGRFYEGKWHGGCTDDCPARQENGTKRTYDWFVVQYVEGDAKPWKLYRIVRTSSPSTDAYHTGKNEPSVKEFASLEEMGAAHFYFYKSQAGALYDAIRAFGEVLKNSGGDHRLAVNGFASGNIRGNTAQSNGSGIYENGTFLLYNDRTDYTEYLTDPKTLYGAATLTAGQYAKALVSVQDAYGKIKKSLDAVKTDYYQTYQNVGLDMAYQILQNAPMVETDRMDCPRKKIVVLFTDGIPVGPTEADVVEKAAQIKALDAEVYAICTGALEEENRAFLKYSSSDYPYANAVNGVIVSGEQNSTPKYFKTAENAEELTQEFLSIVQGIGGVNIALDVTTVLQDAISDDFTLPKELLEALNSNTKKDEMIKKYIKVFTADYDGKQKKFGSESAFEDAKISIEKDSDQKFSIVKVQNFDYAANFISEIGRGKENQFYGRKLIVKIAIDTADGNLGGNYQKTNDETLSGIYFKEKLQKAFPLPHTDVPTTVKVSKQIVGDGAEKNKKFQFRVGVSRSSSYQDTEQSLPNGNYLAAKSASQTDSFALTHGEVYELTNVKVGTTLTIAETPETDYAAKIQVWDAENQEVPVTAENGSYTVEVVPGMQIVYTNTYQRADLVIEKTGVDTSDHNNEKKQSTIFRITGSDGFTMDVAIVGNDSVTIKNIPVGDYTVTEMTDWSWRYEPKQKSINVTVRSTGKNGVKFQNIRKDPYWLSGDSYCENWWGSQKEAAADRQKTDN